MLKNIFKIVAFFVIGMVGGIFADQIFWPYFVERPLFYQYKLEKSPVYLTERKEVTIQENVALTNAVEKVEKTVVGVKTQTEEGEVLEGSGLIVTSDGLIVTLAQLVPQGSDFSFFVDDKQAAFQILKRDLSENLALVKIEESNLPTVSFADLEKTKLGERIFLIGIIFDGKKNSKTINEGIINGFNGGFIQTNIFEKNVLAGSPLFNIQVEVLGLNFIDSEGRVSSVPVSKIKSFIGM